MTRDEMIVFGEAWDDVAKEVHANAKAKGFWDRERNDGEALALIQMLCCLSPCKTEQ